MITLHSIRCPADESVAARLKVFGTHRLSKGETIRFSGPNGAGKTTLLRIVAGLEFDYAGEVERPDSLQIRLIPTSIMDLLLPWYSVSQNARVLLNHARDDTRFTGFVTLLEQFLPGEIDRVRDLPVHPLSAGEKAAVACACALASKPHMIALDETLSYMAPSMARRVIPAIMEFAKTGGTVLVVGHYMPEQLIPTREIVVTPRGER